ncbi:hypothetical protein DAEQUDRAFT_761537 [Daedalea quercina L-15889]|uniref:Uncharacterized protein n=1 Tax=Daedalea quercina L-15889 TaxID=1314783 RepID=A0A165TX71_9APHY|nr:hypothetical protein DAEQUDRAFT_761537 [Daedalea quercina L-15889]
MSTPPAAASSQNVTLPVIPELYSPDFLDILLPVKQDAVSRAESDGVTAPEVRNPMIDALKATVHRTFTDNGAPAYSSTLSPTLDAFQVLRPRAQGKDIPRYLEAAWKEDPQLTLRIIWNLRSIHDGKGEKDVFYQAYGWLYENHPRTAIVNLPKLIERLCTRPKKDEAMSHGYWKDLLNIVALAELDQLSPREDRAPFLHSPRGHPYDPKSDADKRVPRSRLRSRGRSRGRWVHSVPARGPQSTKVERAQAGHARLEAKLQDPKFRALYVMVARLFADNLARDVDILNEMDKVKHGSDEWWKLSKRLSLVGKWAPSPTGAHDRVTNLSTAVSLLLHDAGISSTLRINVSRESPLPSLETHVLRSFYQRWVLTPLRRALALPEPLMSAGRWKDIIYWRVASRCMKINTPNFYKHNPEGFEAYITKVESGKKKISGATLMPHEIVQAVLQLKDAPWVHARRSIPEELGRKLDAIQARVLEAQWASLVQRLREAGQLDSALAVCDVSGSMDGEPLHVSLALSLITAQLAKPPFSNGFVTFSRHPQFHTVDVDKNGLARTLEDMQNTDFGLNTNFHAVFVKLLLPIAVQNKVRPEDMIKTLFVFSDMQFDEAARTKAGAAAWATNHDAIERAYKEAGYEVPRIVYWDLAGHGGRGMTAMPVTSDRKGVALMNGFSPAMLKVFMGDADAEEVADEIKDTWHCVGNEEREVGDTVVDAEEFNPLNIMKKAVSKKSFDGLVVVD